MATTVKNLGIANPKVEFLAQLPNIGSYVQKTTFDVTAHNWNQLQNSQYFCPTLLECVMDSEQTIAAILPAKRKYYIPNFLAGGGALAARTASAASTSTPTSSTSTCVMPFITWTPISSTSATGTIMEKIIPEYTPYTLIMPANYSTITSEYKGPRWYDKALRMEPPSNDWLSIQKLWTALSGGVTPTTPTPTACSSDLIPNIPSVNQETVADGLWWGIESSAFLETENMPFWINIKRQFPPTSSKHDTVLCISLGLTDTTNRYDIYLSLNNKPRLVDWLSGPGGTPIDKQWDDDLSRILSEDEYIEIGIMTIAGRLVVIVNNSTLVYARIDRSSGENNGKLLEAKISPGAIRLWGTNCKVTFNVCPMTFAPVGIMPLPIPQITGSGAVGGSTSYKGTDFEGKPANSICHLPTPPGVVPQLFGCDCKSFLGDGGTASPVGYGFHKKGKVYFYKATSLPSGTFGGIPSSDFFILYMEPEDSTLQGQKVPNGRCPYFFRLKGINIQTTAAPSVGTPGNFTDYVISIDETCSAPDYFHVKKNATISFYDPKAVVSGGIVLNQTGVKISWGWDDGGGSSQVQTFTGIITNVSTNMVAGKETCTISIEDYVYILKNTPIINSPFYDGMVAYFAIKDLAERVGCTSFVNDWDTPNNYFLPSGFAFSKPAMRFDSKQSIFDCMMNIVKRFEAYIYFDAQGKLTIAKLPGGLFSTDTTHTIAMTFTSDPFAGNQFILGERSLDVNYDNTVNSIAIFSLERDTRNAIVYNCIPSTAGMSNHLLFRKTMFRDEPALGELEVAKAWAHDLGARMFCPILKTRFKTAGNTTMIQPLDFVSVDGQTFRLMSLKRSYKADTNDFSNDYECEWLGGSCI